MKTTTPKDSTAVPRKLWDAAKARHVLEQQVRSGQSLAAFSRTHHIPPHILYAWRRRLARTVAQTKQTGDFLPLRVTTSTAVTPHQHGIIEIVFSTGPKVRITGTVETAQLTAVLRSLQEASC